MVLKSKEKKLAELMCLYPSMRNIDYAKECGISEKSLYVYKAKPEFQEYLSKLCKQRFRSMEALAINKLNEEINNNNFKAIQYLLDSMGYKAPEQQEVYMNANITIDYGDEN